MSNNLIIRDAKLIFRNFEGEETQFNRAGDRNFSVIIDDTDQAQQLIEDGWNLKLLRRNDPDDEPAYHLKVTVRLDDNWPAKLFLVNRRGQPVRIYEESMKELDNEQLDRVDLTINPSNWSVNGKTGIKAYLRDLYATIVEDELYSEYHNPYDDGRTIERNAYFIPRRR